jgi:hypothetical protein
MRTTKSYYRPVDPQTVQRFWDMGLDTYEISLRTGCKESDVHRAVSDYRNQKWVGRFLRDKNRTDPPTQC